LTDINTTGGAKIDFGKDGAKVVKVEKIVKKVDKEKAKVIES
jgi:hypothetical protein